MLASPAHRPIALDPHRLREAPRTARSRVVVAGERRRAEADRAAACRAAIEAAGELVFDDPQAALAAAVAATDHAEALTGRPSADLDRADLAAEAWAHRGNAERVLADLPAAEGSFATARRHLGQGSGRPLLLARVDELEASLRQVQQRDEEALELVAEAIRRYRGAGSTQRLGRALVKKGFYLLTAGQAEAALPAFAEAVSLLEPEADLRTYLMAASNVMRCLHELGYSIAARALLAELRPLHERLGDRLNVLRLDWFQAHLDLELGRHKQAEAGLVAVRDTFLERAMAYDAALVSLELATLYAEQKRFLALRRLALEMLPIFQSRGIHREALAALILFRESISFGRGDLVLIEEVRRFLDRARHNPGLRFRPAS